MRQGHPADPGRDSATVSRYWRQRTGTALELARVQREKGYPAAALLTAQGALETLPNDGRLAPEDYADLQIQLLLGRDAVVEALTALERDPRPARRRRVRRPAGGRPRLWRGRPWSPATLGGLALFAVGSAALVAAAAQLAADAGGLWAGLAPWCVTVGAVATVLVTTAVLAPSRRAAAPPRG